MNGDKFLGWLKQKYGTGGTGSSQAHILKSSEVEGVKEKVEPRPKRSRPTKRPGAKDLT